MGVGGAIYPVRWPHGWGTSWQARLRCGGSVAGFVGHGGDGEQCGRVTWGQVAAWGAVGDGAVETALHEMLQVGILCCSRAFEFVS